MGPPLAGALCRCFACDTMTVLAALLADAATGLPRVAATLYLVTQMGRSHVAPAHLCRRSLTDRQAGSLAVRPTHEQFLHMSVNWWKAGTVVALRDRAMFLEQILTAGRGGDIRETELADRFTYEYPTKPMKAVALLTIKQNGKTNQVCGEDKPGVWLCLPVVLQVQAVPAEF